MVLAIDPLTPSTVYAGTEAGVVFRTADAGRTWIGTGVTNQNASTVLVPTNAHSTSSSRALLAALSHLEVFHE